MCELMSFDMYSTHKTQAEGGGVPYDGLYSVSSGYPNTEKGVENTTRSGVFLTKFEVFG